MSSQRSRKRLFLTLAALLVVACVVIGFLLFSGPKPPPDATFASEAERAQVAQNLESRVNTFKQSVQNRQPAAPLQIQEREVNAVLRAPQTLQKLEAKGVTNPSVKIEKDKVFFSGDVAVNGVKLPVTVIGSPSGASGFQVTSVKFGQMPAPQKVTDEIAKQADEAIRSGSVVLPPGISGVRVEDGKIIVNGQ